VIIVKHSNFIQSLIYLEIVIAFISVYFELIKFLP